MIIGWGWQKTWGFIAAVLIVVFLFIFVSTNADNKRQLVIQQHASDACKLLNRKFLAVGTYADVNKGTYLTLCGAEKKLAPNVDEIIIEGRVEFVLR